MFTIAVSGDFRIEQGPPFAIQITGTGSVLGLQDRHRLSVLPAMPPTARWGSCAGTSRSAVPTAGGSRAGRQTSGSSGRPVGRRVQSARLWISHAGDRSTICPSGGNGRRQLSRDRGLSLGDVGGVSRTTGKTRSSTSSRMPDRVWPASTTPPAGGQPTSAAASGNGNPRRRLPSRRARRRSTSPWMATAASRRTP